MNHTYKYLQNHPNGACLPHKSESIGDTLLAQAGGVFFYLPESPVLELISTYAEMYFKSKEEQVMGGYEGGAGYGGYGGFHSIGAILVLFILLVIISKAFWV